MVFNGLFFLILCHWIKDHQDQNLSLALKNVEEANSVKKKKKHSRFTGYILWLCSVWNTQGCGGTVITTFDCTAGKKTKKTKRRIAVWYKNHREALGLTSGTLYWLRPEFSGGLIKQEDHGREDWWRSWWCHSFREIYSRCHFVIHFLLWACFRWFVIFASAMKETHSQWA